ncbi:InlB B-repeat-containing protein [Corynebacterium sp. HS2168-gen11]|uniref:InlB B-repeat-containing protein n=1 Tax=Corynebacterium sp. HS2168-gen11 TaxID=2974027 RepID=UPI00216B5A48|nr:InlB B-repeat-containing protein [Corynebacterium sp. HS2168-gen11]MCS4535750.1 InlB B-repeat-containing protein [Corynebacterium sp. HS2168-gen11]
MQQRLKLAVATLMATSLCIGSVVPVQAQSNTNSVEVAVAFGNGSYDVNTINSHVGVRDPDQPVEDLRVDLPFSCSGKLTPKQVPDFNLTLIGEDGVERNSVNVKDLDISNCRTIVKFKDLPDGKYSLKAQYDNMEYALFFGREKLEGQTEQILTDFETWENGQFVKNPIEVHGGQRLSSSALALLLTHRPLALRYKTEIGSFQHNGAAVQDVVIYPRRDGEAAKWFEHSYWDETTTRAETFIGIGVPYAGVPAKPLSRFAKFPVISKYNIGKFPGSPELNAAEKEKYVGYKWLGWAAYPWDATEFTEATQLRDANGEKIIYDDIVTGGDFGAYEDILFVAKWDIPTRTISFKTAADEGTINGGTTVEYTIEGNDSLKDLNKEVPKAVALPGYEFVGWFTDLSGNTIAEKDIFEKRNTGDKQYYAKYRQVQTPPTVNHYTFAFDPGAGKIVKGEQSYQVQENSRVDDVPQVEAPKGQEFVGWKRVSDDTLYTNIAELVWRNKATSDHSFVAVYKATELPPKECKPAKSPQHSWLIALLPIIGGVIATVVPVVNKFLAGIVNNIKPQALKDFEAWMAQHTGSSVSEEAQAAGTVITASTVLGVLSWWLFSKQEDKC